MCFGTVEFCFLLTFYIVFKYLNISVLYNNGRMAAESQWEDLLQLKDVFAPQGTWWRMPFNISSVMGYFETDPETPCGPCHDNTVINNNLHSNIGGLKL